MGRVHPGDLQASDFFIREKDSFANPVGGAIRDALKKTFALLMQQARIPLR
jgi:hypothetical protein